MFRVGLGQDSHPFDKNKSLVLGGVYISKNNGLRSRSDGDVILHSLCNALSSAVGGDSLGTWADGMCLKQGIKDSKEYIKYIFNKVRRGYRVGNISVSVEAKTPRLSLMTMEAIKNKIAQLLEVEIGQVGITFTSGEGLTPFGRGKGIQAITIISLVKND